MNPEISNELKKRLLRMQRDELTGSILYAHMAKRQKDERNKRVFEDISRAERGHCETWKSYTGQEVSPNRAKIALFG